MVEAHAARAHSPVGPSTLHRIDVCRASVRLSEGQPNESSVFALEGTAAHELCEHVMVTRIDPQDYVGGIVDLGVQKPNGKHESPPVPFYKDDGTQPFADSLRYWPITEEMVEAVELYRDTLDAYMVGIDFDDELGMDVLEFECRLDMRHIFPDFYGTGDALIYVHETRHLIVGDFKYGSGLVVECEDNLQLIAYALGAAHRFHNYGIDLITMVIVQPRAWHPKGPVRKWTITFEELKRFEAKVRDILVSTDDPNATAHAGTHCRFCPAAWGCEELRRHSFEALGIKMQGKLPDDPKRAVNLMSTSRLGTAMREMQTIEIMIRAVAKRAHSEALDGRIPEGMKIVPTRAYRKFTNRDEVLAICDLLGVDDDAIYTEPKLRTVAQIETIVGKKTFREHFGDIVEKKSSGVVLAMLDDHREAVKFQEGAAFGAVEDE